MRPGTPGAADDSPGCLPQPPTFVTAGGRGFPPSDADVSISRRKPFETSPALRAPCFSERWVAPHSARFGACT